MTKALRKTKSSFYRRLYVAHLIAQGVASVPALIEATGMPRRTAQDTITSLAELDIECVFEKSEGRARFIPNNLSQPMPVWLGDMPRITQ
jgi:hypothetical protein